MWLYRETTKFVRSGAEEGAWEKVYEVGYLKLLSDAGAVFQEFQVVEDWPALGLARSAVNYLNGGNCIQ